MSEQKQLNYTKEIHIDMVVSTTEADTEDSVSRKFVEWIDQQGWLAGGMVVDITGQQPGLSYAEAVEAMLGGYKVALPEWGGHWSAVPNPNEAAGPEDLTILVTLKDGLQTITPSLHYMLRKDWKIVG